MHDKQITLSEAAKLSPGRPSANAVWRWCRRGIKSRSGQQVKLEHIRAGGKIFTTSQALDRFFAAVAQADAEHFDCPGNHAPLSDSQSSTTRKLSGSQRRRSIEQAEAILDQAGI